MATYMNEAQLPLSIAAYLACDFYDYIPNTLSATSLLKPVRQLVLKGRVPEEMSSIDVQNMLASRMGTAIHDGIEKVWMNGHYKEGLASLGYPEHVIERVVVNPDPDNLPQGAIPVYMEQRLFREINGQTISGKFDFIGEGRLEDFKSTSVFTWLYQTKTEDYQLQGSIYRWLDQGKRIKDDHMQITFIFKDFSPAKAKQEPKYPRSPVLGQSIPLLSLDDTEAYIRDRLRQVERFRDAPEMELPLCSDKDLWRSESQWKVYKTLESKRAMPKGTFDNPSEAAVFAAEKGGVVKEIPGEVKACKWCPAFPICTQKDRYLEDGTLKI